VSRPASVFVRPLSGEEAVRRVIRDFNEMGMDLVRPQFGADARGGSTMRPVNGSVLALSPAQDLGEPFTRWSLTTLRRYLVRADIVDTVSREHLRRIEHPPFPWRHRVRRCDARETKKVRPRVP
jgi:hypothetical protein